VVSRYVPEDKNKHDYVIEGLMSNDVNTDLLKIRSSVCSPTFRVCSKARGVKEVTPSMDISWSEWKTLAPRSLTCCTGC